MLQELIIVATAQIVATVLLVVFTTLFLLHQLKPFRRIGEIVEGMDLKNTKNIAGSLGKIANAAATLDEALNDEELFEEYALKIAQKVKTVMTMTVLGVKSGNVKKLQKAERIIQEGMVKATKEMSPALSMVLKMTGIDEILEDEPDLLPYLLQAAGDKGLLDNLAGMLPQLGNLGLGDLGSLATPDTSDGKGINF